MLAALGAGPERVARVAAEKDKVSRLGGAEGPLAAPGGALDDEGAVLFCLFPRGREGGSGEGKGAEISGVEGESKGTKGTLCTSRAQRKKKKKKKEIAFRRRFCFFETKSLTRSNAAILDDAAGEP